MSLSARFCSKPLAPISVCLLAITLLATAPFTSAQSSTNSTTKLDALVVSGELPGPGMWRITHKDKPDHALWIVGSHSPLPTKMKWRSKDVEAVIAKAQEVLEPPSVNVSVSQIGFWNTLTLIPSAMEGRKNPDNAKLVDLVPPDVYARWLVLRDKYVDNTSTDENDIELWRPIFAALELYQKAIAKNGLTGRNPVLPSILDLAKKHRVKVVPVKYTPQIENPRQMVREFKKTRLADLDCFTKTIERIETDLAAMRVRANAWSTGDIPKLRSMEFTDQRSACEAAIRSGTFMKNVSESDFSARLNEMWISAAAKALDKNKVTLGVLTIERLLAKNGVLDQFVARGYKVESPDDLIQ